MRRDMLCDADGNGAGEVDGSICGATCSAAPKRLGNPPLCIPALL